MASGRLGVKHTLTGAALTVALVVGSPVAAYAVYGTQNPAPPQGGAGNGIVLPVTPTTFLPGSAVNVGGGSNTKGVCTPGTAVTFQLVLVEPGSTPVTLSVTNPPSGGVVATSSGGIPPETVTIPSNVAPGAYSLFASCSGPNGTQVIASGVTVTGSPTAHALVAPKAAWVPPSTWATPAVRAVTALAVNSSAQKAQAPAATSSASPSETQLAAELAAARSRADQRPMWLGYLAALLLFLEGQYLFRRRRMAAARP